MDAKWKSLFQSKEEMIAVNNQLAEQVWNDDEKMDYGKAKDNAAKELGLNKEKPEPEAPMPPPDMGGGMGGGMGGMM